MAAEQRSRSGMSLRRPLLIASVLCAAAAEIIRVANAGSAGLIGVGLGLIVVAVLIGSSLCVGRAIGRRAVARAELLFPGAWVRTAVSDRRSLVAAIDSDGLRLLTRKGKIVHSWARPEIRSVSVEMISASALLPKPGLHVEFNYGSRPQDVIFIRWAGVKASRTDAMAAKAMLTESPITDSAS